VFVPELGATFAFDNKNFIKRSAGGEVTRIEPPANLPQGATPNAAGYDSKRKLVLWSIFNHLYSYDPADGRWAMLRATEFILGSLAYDERRDQYVTMTPPGANWDVVKYHPTDPGQKAVRVSSRFRPNLYPGLADLGRDTLAWTDLEIHAIQGDNMVLVAQDESGRRYRIYVYDLSNDTVALTHFQNP